MRHKTSLEGLTPGQRMRAIKRVLWVILALNIVVALAKFFYGLATDTTSMQADGIHSLFDSAGNIIGLIGMALASRPADYDHPYGHGKFETFASAIIGVLLLLAAYNVASEAVLNLIHGSAAPRVSAFSFIVMCGTLIVNFCVTTWERREGARLASEILLADAKHTLSDVLVSLGVIVGLILVKLGFPIADPILSLIVAIAIVFTAITVFRQALSTLSDKARIPASSIIAIVDATDEAAGCHEVRTRGTEGEVYVDLHLLVAPTMTVERAHEVADKVEDAIIEAFPQVKDVIVHIEPDDEAQRAVTRAEHL